MPLATRLSDLAVDTEADALAALLDGGFVDVLTGPQPEKGDDPVTTQVVLATMSFGRPAFMKSKGGNVSSNPLNPGVGVADGDPKWFRAYRADHKTPVLDGSAGLKGKGFNMELPAKTIVQGVTVGCSGITHTVPKTV